MGGQFTQLAELLIELNQYDTEQEQLNAIERRLVAAELHPSCYDYDNLRLSLKLLSKLDLTGREWQSTPEELETYF
jgi:hypothetical protein